MNLGSDDFSRIVVFDGDDPISVAEKFCIENGNLYIINVINIGLDEKKKSKLIAIIQA